MPVDPRFYAPLGALTLQDIADCADAELSAASETTITGLAAFDVAGPNDICFHDAGSQAIGETNAEAGACFCTRAQAQKLPVGVPALITAYPRRSFAIAAAALFQPISTDQSAKPIDMSAQIAESAVIAPGVVIGAGAVIGERTIVSANAVIGAGVQIGHDCYIGAHASVRCALIGNHVRLLAGARIGETGFGVTPGPDGLEDAPHYGRVILQDHVTIGANSCIDRGALGDTIIGERTKIDNLCQIAHNVVIGRGVVMAAFAGISGSVSIGDHSRLGGRVGIADHVHVGEGASLAASAGLFRDVPDGETWGGTPAKPAKQWMRELAWLQKQSKARKKT